MKSDEVVVTIVGGGLAGSEAAWQLVNRGIKVKIIEMRPQVMTPAHQTSYLAELVCSNSLRSNLLTNAVGVLKEEMRMFNSLIMKVADQTSLPAGSALAVDRTLFASSVTEHLKNHPLVTIVNEEVNEIPEGPTIIASGPLTSSKLELAIKNLLNDDQLYFYDAVAPIVEKDSIDFSKAYYKSRYDKGEADYINCPLDTLEFQNFYKELITAKTVELQDFEKELFFESCMPIEVMAKRGPKNLLFGPLKPVCLELDNISPTAVVQLRQDDVADSLYNMVGFQTNLTWGEQQRVFRLIPGLENANFVRYGVMHRNTYLNSPSCLKSTFQFKDRSDLFFAGQITGVEGYVESAASGMIAGINMALLLNDRSLLPLTNTTVIGSLAHYITHSNPHNFQPMHANFGIMSLEESVSKKERKAALAKQALAKVEELLNDGYGSIIQ